MSTHDKSTTFPNGASDGRPDQHFPTDQRQSYNNTQTPAPLSSRVNGFPPPVPDLNSPLQSPTMSPSILQARQPINEAVASAFQTTDNNMPPELIQLITQNVIQQIQAHKLSIPTAQPVQPPQNPLTTSVDQSDNASSFATSPVTDRSQVYTPPSPRRSASIVNAHGYETGIRRELSPFQHTSDEEAVLSDPESTTARPEAPRRSSTQVDVTVLEKIWGELFDNQGNGTRRLDLFLRGIAVHLIEDYEPKSSMVIKPHKMQRYYDETNLTNQPEVYPWQLIFDDGSSQISRLFRESDIMVEHHLLPKRLDERPSIPALTTDGFVAWMKLLIKAHPDHEFERLSQTIRKMPINNPDTKERFPKELSRRLFPATGDDRIAMMLAKHMAKHCQVQIHPRKPSEAESEPSQSQQSPPSTSRRPNPPAPFVEDASEDSDFPDSQTVPVQTSTSTADTSGARLRETISRSSVSTGPAETPIEVDSSDIPTPKPLERERNPYVGGAGGRKTYDATSSSGDEKRAKVNRSRRNSAAQEDLRRIKSTSATQGRNRPPPIAIHQRDNTAQPDGPESGRARRSTVNNDDQGNSVHRTRSNSTYGAEVQPSRRRRSNSTYGNDAPPTRYHSKRSPSLSKSGFDLPRASAPEIKIPNYPPPPNAYANNYPTNSAPQQGYPQPGYDYRNQNYDSRDPRDSRNRDRDRERDHDRRSSRSRMQSMASPTTADPYNYPEELHRQQSGYPTTNGNFVPPVPGQYQYPPNAYHSRDPRDTREPRDSRESRESRDPREPR